MKKTAIKKLTAMAMLTALSIVLVWLIHFPIFPAAPFLEYDPADIPIFIGTFLFGPGAGLALTLVVCVIQGTTVSAASNIIGILMHFFATGSFVLVAGLIYRKKHTRLGAVVSLAAGILTMTTVMVFWNLIFTPMFGTPLEVVKEIMVPVIIPFNLLKATANSVITYLVYKPVAQIMRLDGALPAKART